MCRTRPWLRHTVHLTVYNLRRFTIGSHRSIGAHALSFILHRQALQRKVKATPAPNALICDILSNKD